MAVIRCLSCPSVYAPASIEPQHISYGARVAGWVVWEGPTEGGEQVKRIHCPACRGQEIEEPKAPEPSWDAVCKTCDFSMAEDWSDSKDPFTEEDCKTWKAEHECEKWVEFVPPSRAAIAAYDRDHVPVFASTP